jgi:hypothetical protein
MVHPSLQVSGDNNDLDWGASYGYRNSLEHYQTLQRNLMKFLSTKPAILDSHRACQTLESASSATFPIDPIDGQCNRGPSKC